MRRRTVVLGLLGGTLGSLTSACQPNRTAALRVHFLDQSLPPQVIKSFHQQLLPKTQLDFAGATQLLDLFKQLQKSQTSESSTPSLWQRWLPIKNDDPPVVPPQVDLVTLGDIWFESAIQQQLIEPLPLATLPNWSQLPEPWQVWATRNSQGQIDPQGQIWGAPYRVQSLMLAYQKPVFQRLDWQPMHWSDLWRPELAGRIAILNHPRIVLGLALKVLGYSINDESAFTTQLVRDQLASLYRQVRLFDSTTALKALVNEDIWLTVGWSSDILTALTRYQHLQATFPQEGTIFVNDLWVKPKVPSVKAATASAATALNPLALKWIDFCWQRPAATEISLSSRGLSPIFLKDASVPAVLSQASRLLPTPTVLDRSELLRPLSASCEAALKATIGIIG